MKFLAIPLILLSTLACIPGEDPMDVVSEETLNAEPTYADIVPIMQAHCIRCHGETLAAEDWRVDSYNVLLDELEENVCTSIHPSVGEAFDIECEEYFWMPPVGKPTLSADEQVLFVRWMQLGAPR